MNNDDIEIKSAERTIELLKQYKSATTQEQRDILLKQMDEVDGFANRYLSQENITPDELITKITKAISLNQYRPKNLPITIFAMDEDLDFINGDFDTFDPALHRMFKKGKLNDTETKRIAFKIGTKNIDMLAKQFSADWIRRLNNHKDLVMAARNADDNNIIDAYNALFVALTKDFCDEYDLIIDTKVITDWSNSDKRKKLFNPDDTGGYHASVCNFHYLPKILNYMKHTLKGVINLGYLPKTYFTNYIKYVLGEFKKYQNYHQKILKTTKVYINIANIKKYSTQNNFFYKMITAFAHEMHHALDFQKPQQGALGPQLQEIDSKTYVHNNLDEKAYYASATEISSYAIGNALFNKLKESGF